MKLEQSGKQIPMSVHDEGKLLRMAFTNGNFRAVLVFNPAKRKGENTSTEGG